MRACEGGEMRACEGSDMGAFMRGREFKKIHENRRQAKFAYITAHIFFSTRVTHIYFRGARDPQILYALTHATGGTGLHHNQTGDKTTSTSGLETE